MKRIVGRHVSATNITMMTPEILGVLGYRCEDLSYLFHERQDRCQVHLPEKGNCRGEIGATLMTKTKV